MCPRILTQRILSTRLSHCVFTNDWRRRGDHIPRLRVDYSDVIDGSSWVMQNSCMLKDTSMGHWSLAYNQKDKVCF